MGLEALQAAAARLSVDAAARQLLRENPAAFAREAALDAEELATLQEKSAEFEAFARSLVNKRANEAARAMPLTVEALGGEFRRTFAVYAEEVEVARDPALDAIGFLRWLRHNDQMRDIARYELVALQFRRSNRWLELAIFHFRGHAPPRLPKRFLACWWRTSAAGPPCYFQWPSC